MIKCEKKIPSKEELWDKYYMDAPEQQRRAIQNSKESIAKLSNTKDADMDPKHPRSTVLTLEEEALHFASIHCYQRHNISKLPDVDDEVKAKKKFKQ